MTEQLYHLVNLSAGTNSAPRESLAASFPARAEETLRTARLATRAGQVAQTACETAWKAFEQHRMQIFEVETLRNEVAQFLHRSEQRMQQAQMTAAQAVKMAAESRERICNTAAPAICDRKNGDIFRRYDQDEDGMLSANEVTSFCRLEYGFALPQANLDRILQHLGASGAKAPAVEPTRFHQLRTAVGIARFELRAKKAKEIKAATTAGDTQAVAAATAEDEKLKLEFQGHLKQRQQQIEKDLEQIAWSDLEKKVADVEAASASFVKAAADGVGEEELQRFESALDTSMQQTRGVAVPSYVNQLRALQHEALQLSMKEAEVKGKEKEEEKVKEAAPETKEGGECTTKVVGH